MTALILERRAPRLDPTLTLLGLALLLVGLVSIASASIEFDDWHYNNPWYHSLRHLIYLVVALMAVALVVRTPLQVLQKTGWIWLFGALALLVLVLVPGIGREVKGGQRWLPLGVVTVQPSELAKAAVVIYLAGYLSRHAELARSGLKGFGLPVAVLFAVGLLLVVEPDYGATVIVVGTALGMMFLAGMRLWPFTLVLVVALLGLAALALFSDYRESRIATFLDPWADPYGEGLQLIQSMIAFARGEWLGVGLGNSVQKLFYLPEAHNDFVFSIWAEETGFVGAALVIGLYVALVARILQVGRQSAAAGADFGAYLCYGVALMFSGQAFINLGVSSGLLPTKGLTLPFISYGGSSLVVCCMLLAMVLRVQAELPAGTPQALPGSRR
ncbi:MAG: putative lipid II flippase FtsW [Parahaliea sp.]